ncbi:hypothetical protein [Carboxylicivirga linearis]|uniref:Sigma-70 family RNA polymerase sigma factor n=1 Tax=Carboxylicivirga linearis TaxID=1628157 RepID=A0ABS5K2B3_9BACT|nr:hypothetical protein [Carboxylicivirga linearis]MBS2101195.1 hypothetical protein [Carboxylicivirga linearis]
MEQLKITSDYDNIEWEKVIKVLMAYAYVLIGDNNEMEKSRADLAYDYTMEAISKYLSDKSKFDSSRNPDLISFLKYNYLRQIISNGKTSGKYKYEDSYEDVNDSSAISKETFIKDYYLEEHIDVNSIVLQIEETLATDNELLPLFKCKYYEDSKRSEICDDLSISSQEYDNRMKRLRRIVKNITQTANGHE